MTLASTVVVCLLFAVSAGAASFRASPPSFAQPQSQENASSPQQPPAGAATPAPPPAEAPEQNAPPEKTSPDGMAPNPSSDAGQTTAPDASSPAPKQEPPGTQPAPAAASPTAKPPHAKKKKRSSPANPKPTAASSQAPLPTKKVVVKNGSAADPSLQISPGLSQQQASSQREGTSQLLASTDENLKKISERRLESTQQEMVRQVRKYVEQSKAATDAGDLDRAHNLALKANLLAQELAKP